MKETAPAASRRDHARRRAAPTLPSQGERLASTVRAAIQRPKVGGVARTPTARSWLPSASALLRRGTGLHRRRARPATETGVSLRSDSHGRTRQHRVLAITPHLLIRATAASGARTTRLVSRSRRRTGGRPTAGVAQPQGLRGCTPTSTSPTTRVLGHRARLRRIGPLAATIFRPSPNRLYAVSPPPPSGPSPGIDDPAAARSCPGALPPPARSLPVVVSCSVSPAACQAPARAPSLRPRLRSPCGRWALPRPSPSGNARYRLSTASHRPTPRATRGRRDGRPIERLRGQATARRRRARILGRASGRDPAWHPRAFGRTVATRPLGRCVELVAWPGALRRAGGTLDGMPGVGRGNGSQRGPGSQQMDHPRTCPPRGVRRGVGGAGRRGGVGNARRAGRPACSTGTRRGPSTTPVRATS